MIEHLKEEIPDPLLEERLRSLGLEGWIPWSKNASGTPGSHMTYTKSVVLEGEADRHSDASGPVPGRLRGSA